jgi:hypothetical protein
VRRVSRCNQKPRIRVEYAVAADALIGTHERFDRTAPLRESVRGQARSFLGIGLSAQACARIAVDNLVLYGVTEQAKLPGAPSVRLTPVESHPAPTHLFITGRVTSSRRIGSRSVKSRRIFFGFCSAARFCRTAPVCRIVAVEIALTVGVAQCLASAMRRACLAARAGNV